MQLYCTTLKIKNKLVPYIVSREEGNKFLLYKPQPPIVNLADAPIFWVAKQEGTWVPINVNDKALISQVVNDISVHKVD